MAVSGTSSTGLLAFHNAKQLVSQAADKIAKNDNLQSQTEAVVTLKQGELLAQAAARIIEVENKIAGSLLDIKA